MKKLNPNKPVYSQIKDLLSTGEGPWKIQASNKVQTGQARASISITGKQQGVKYTASVDDNLVMTIERLVAKKQVEEKETLYEVTFGSKDMTLKRVSPSTQDILLKAIAAREAAVSALTTELRYNQEVLKALIEVRDSAPF